MNKFFVLPAAVKGSCIYVRDKDDIKHMVKVLRMKAGDEIEISDGNKYEYKAVIEKINQDEICCRIHDKQSFAREPSLKVTLFQAVPKQGKMESVIQKAVEMGVVSITPVFTSRTVVEYKGNLKNKSLRWQKVASEAVKQCKRGVIPLVRDAVSFKQMKEEIVSGQFDLVIFPYENEEETTMKQALRSLKEEMPHDKIAVIIGPEGGFSDEEADMLISSGAICVSLGKTILRTETAGIAAISMIMYELEM